MTLDMNELFEAMITEYYGPRCEDFEADCVVCEMWDFYDIVIRDADVNSITYSKHASNTSLQSLGRALRNGQAQPPKILDVDAQTILGTSKQYSWKIYTDEEIDKTYDVFSDGGVSIDYIRKMTSLDDPEPGMINPDDETSVWDLIKRKWPKL